MNIHNRRNRKMVEKTTAGVRIQVETAYQFQDSKPAEQYYVFAYRITIRNEAEVPVQLLSRLWNITDSIREPKTVNGEGVVGQKPVIEPGEKFVYTSGCQLWSDLGLMEGHYVMVNLTTGNLFQVDIPAFRLEVPYRLN